MLCGPALKGLFTPVDDFARTVGDESGVYGAGDFVSVDRDVPHAGRNASDGESELLIVDYWPVDSDDRIGLD